MAQYISEFTSINGVNYKVQIITENGTNTTNFVLGGKPFVTTMDSDGKTIYAPIKTTGATVEMLTDKMPFDIYNEKNQGTKVILTNTDTDKIEWVGYVTPCAYTQGFDNAKEVVEIECVDGIASLKDVPFRSVKSIDTFLNIIFKILKRAECYRNLYVTDNIKLTQYDTADILSKLRISEQNFYDSKDYEAQPDDDVAWDCYDVLFEIMQYMGYTLIAQGDEVYIMDYDAIVSGRKIYYKYDISGDTISAPTTVNISNSYHITGSSYAENGTNVSLTELFNQCTVVDEFNENESLFENIDAAKNFINITSTTNALSNANEYREYINGTIKNANGEDEPILIMIKRVAPEATLSGGANNRGEYRYYLVIAKFYTNPLITTYHYANNASHTPVADSIFNPLKYSDMDKYFGSYIAGYFTKCYSEKEYNEWKASWSGDWFSFDTQKKLDLFGKLCNMGNVGSKRLTNYIVGVNLNNENHIQYNNTTQYPYFKITKNIPTIFGGKGAYLVLNGKVRRHNNYTGIFPLDGKPYIHNDTTATNVYINEGYVWAQLKWGNLYWHGGDTYSDKGRWTSQRDYFKLWYGDPTKDVRVTDWLDKDLNVYNNCGALWGVDDTGYYFSIPEDNNLEGKVELTIFANKDTKGKFGRNNAKDKKNSYSGYPPFVMLYSDFDIKLGYADNALNNDVANSDTVYTNDVSGFSNVNEMSEIKFKICTFDDKTPSFSVVTYLSGGQSYNLDTTYNLTTQLSLRQEEHFVMKNVAQYEKPRIIFECNLKNSLDIKPWTILTDDTLNDPYFIVDTMGIDYRFNKLILQIIEKNDQYN